MDGRDREDGSTATKPPDESLILSTRSESERLHDLLCYACAVRDAPSPEDVYAEALHALADVLLADGGAVAVGELDGALRVVASGGLSPESVAAIEELPAGTPASSPDLLRLALSPDGFVSVALWPLSDGDEASGLLVAAYRTPHEVDDRERQMAEVLSSHVAAALEQSRRGVAYRLSHGQLRSVLDATGDGIVVHGNDGELLWANEEAARLLGAGSVEELLATSLAEVEARYEIFDADGTPVPPAELPGRRVLADGGPLERLLRYRDTVSGAEHWAVVRTRDLQDGLGGRLGAVTVLRDVTLRQQAVLAHQQSEQRLALLASVGPQLLAAGLETRGVLERMADIMVPALADYCAIREVLPDGRMRRLVIRHADPTKAQTLAKIQGYPLAQQALSEELAAGRSILVEELTDEQLQSGAANEAQLALYRELDVGSLLVVPVQARGRTVGLFLLLRSRASDAFGPSERVLAEDLARRAGLAIDNARLFEEERAARAQAEKTQSEMALLLDASQLLASSLDYEQGLQRLARLAASTLCDLCLIDLRVPEEGTIRRIAAAAADPEQQALADRLSHYPPHPSGDHPAVRVMRSAQPAFAVDMSPTFLEGTTRDQEHYRIVEALGFRSYLSVPLAARGRILGAMTLVATSSSGRRYGPGDVALASDLARRAALALDNTRLYQQTELQTALLTSQTEATTEAILVVSNDGTVLSYNRQLAEMWAIPVEILASRDADDLLAWVAGMVDDPAAFAARVHHLREHRSERARDEVRLLDGRVLDRWSTPLTGEDGGYLGRAWYFRDMTDLRRAEEELTQTYEGERLARMEADRSRSQLSFLLEASTLLAGSVDLDAALARLATLVESRLSDFCAIDLVVDDGHIVRAAAAPGGGPGAELGADAAADVIRTRRPLLVPDVSLAPQEIRRLFRGSAVGSYLGIPLRGRTRTLGGLSLATPAGSGHALGGDDLALAQELGRRVAMALDQAQLFDAQRHISMTLQASLMPPGLPEIPGVEIAARYSPASAISEVGGDFYDLFSVGEGAWAAAIGDVSGKGVEAASMTALARYTIRAAAKEHRQPREILLRLNEAVMDERPSGRFLTVALGRLRWRPAGLRLTVACGGHPPPLLLREDGTVERGGRPGTLLGFLQDPDLPEKVNELKVGDLALLYTDGLTDVRGPGGTFGEERLRSALRQCRGLGAEEIASRLETAVRTFQADEPRDDLAMLVLRVVGPPPAASRFS